MDFLHTEFTGGPDDAVLVSIDGQANVMLLDDFAFSSYQSGTSYDYHGGWASRSPIRLVPPRHSHWHVVVDLGGYAGTVKAGVRIVHRTAEAAGSMGF